MLKRNLIAFAIMSLALILAGSVIAQPNKRKVNVKKQTTSSKSQKTNTAKTKTQNNGRIKLPGKIHAEKNQDIEVEVVAKPKSVSGGAVPATNDYIGETEKNIKKTVNTQKTPKQNKAKKN
jgi:uncharacterized membrane protein YhiD involved in acid resistance